MDTKTEPSKPEIKAPHAASCCGEWANVETKTAGETTGKLQEEAKTESSCCCK
jgi:hypothetical protein